MHVLSLCSGVGMHDVGLSTVFDTRTVCYVEREAFAAAQLVALMEAQCLDAAPIWSDLATFDARAWRGVVDCIVAGLPCQPYSVAGKQLGNDDARAFGDGDGPIAHFVRIVDECGPAVVFLENVTTWVSGGWFRSVGEQLCRLGYEIEDPLFLAADDVGASHQRERVWILAHQPDRGRDVLRDAWRAVADTVGESGSAEQQHESRQRGDKGPQHVAMSGSARSALADDDRDGRGIVSPTFRNHFSDAFRYFVDGRHPSVEYSDDAGRQERRGPLTVRAEFTPVERAGGSLFAPGPLSDRWPRIVTDYPHLAPAIEPRIRRVAHGITWVVDESRRHQLRAIGNGGVPLCAAVAWGTLARRVMNR